MAVIDEWLLADLKAPRKQRHTAVRVWRRLVSEYGAQVSQRTVSGYVAKRKKELGIDRQEVYVPQAHEDGAEGEVDFGDFHVELAGELTKFALFELRLSASGKSFHAAFTTTGQEAFIEGHVLAFESFGGVPHRIRYDNLKPAVTKVLTGRDRIENEKLVLLRSHYGFDTFFCRPGIDGAHEKGGVEGGIGRFRRNHLVPVPKVDSLADLNELIRAADATDDTRVLTGRSQTVGAAFAKERLSLQPLPVERFDSTLLLNPRVDSKSRVCVRQSYYSVPTRYVGKRVAVRLGAATVEILDGAKVIATHERALTRYCEVLELDHYLDLLERKPGALPGAVALAQAKAAGTFTASHQQYWDALRAVHGDADGTRAFIQVLLAHRQSDRGALIQAMDRAVASGALDPQAVIIDARRVKESVLAPVIPLKTLTRYDRPLPTLAHYDELLERSS